MEKKVAKVFKKYGEKKVVVVKNYKPVTDKSKPTTAIRGARMDLNKAVGRILTSGNKEERKIVGDVMQGNYFEDWDSTSREVIKY